MRRPTAWLGLVLAALIVNACQLLTRTDELEVTTSTSGAGGGGASSASSSTSSGGVCLGGGSDGGVSDGGVSDSSTDSCLHCNQSFTMGINTNDPMLCPTSGKLLTDLRCCACNNLACGGMPNFPCQANPNQDWCENYPASTGCMTCLMTNCPALLCNCMADK